MAATEEKKVQLSAKVEPDTLQAFNDTSDLLIKTGAIKNKGDAVRYLLDQVNLRRLVDSDEWSHEVQNLTHYSEMIVKTFQGLVDKTKGKYSRLEEEKERELDEVRGEVAELQAFTKSFQDELKQRDELTGKQAREIEELRKQLEERNSEYDNLKVQYQSVHTLFEEANENRKLILAEKERNIEMLQQRIDEQGATITALEATVQELKAAQHEQAAQHETQLLQVRGEYEKKLNEARADHTKQLASIEEKAEQQRQSYETKIEAIRSEQEASRQSLRAELEQKYEEKLTAANERIQSLTAQAATADTLRQLAEERIKELVAAASVKKPTTTTRKPKKGEATPGLQKE